MIELISDKTRDQIEELFYKVESNIYIISPFLSMKTAEMLCSLCKKKDIKCTLITRIYIKDLLDGVNDLNAIRLLLKVGVEIYALEALHAKLYLFDETTIILGSANFTLAGLEKNFELSVLTDEISVVEQGQLVIDKLIEHCKKDNEGVITEELVDQIEENYKEADIKMQKDSGYISYKMYGAKRINKYASKKDDNWKEKDILISEVDPIYDLFAENHIKKSEFKHNIWAKFEGRGEERQPGNEVPTVSKVTIDGTEKYIVNFRTRPTSIATGDKIYIISYTTSSDGKAAINIVGRGNAVAHINNKVKQEWINKYPWMHHYHYFCEIDNLELLNIPREECIPLEQVHDALGKRTYVSTLDKDELTNLTKVRCRRSHLRLTMDAMEYIDKEIDKLLSIYGIIGN